MKKQTWIRKRHPTVMYPCCILDSLNYSTPVWTAEVAGICSSLQGSGITASGRINCTLKVRSI